ncbi:helix-turn-helix transcriptional regulator, partial [Streptomyces sp. NPDC051940]|uniref:helix-turn-helix transcriptional regulator n=1 Tax=Streptomyces sp. NPDC051940 TaxID=3155675 RepID=UPI003443B46C
RTRGAPAAAAELLDLALGLGAVSPDRLIRLGICHFEAGDTAQARTALEKAVAGLGPGEPRAEALLQLAAVRLHDDSYREAAVHLEQARAEAGAGTSLHLRVVIQLMYVLVNLGRIPEAVDLAGPVLDAARRTADGHLESLALASATIIRYLGGQGLDEAALRRSLQLENPDVPTVSMLRPSLIAGALLAWTGRLAEGRERLVALRRRCLERGEESALMYVDFYLVGIECWSGDAAAALALAEDAEQRAEQLGSQVPRAIALTVRAAAEACAGRAEQAVAAAGEAVALFLDADCAAAAVWPAATLGAVRVAEGDHAAAAGVLGPVLAGLAGIGLVEPVPLPMVADGVEALVGLGRIEEAEPALALLEAAAGREPQLWAPVPAARSRALLLAARGRLDEAADAAEEAVAACSRLPGPMPLERARSLLVLGQVRRRRRQKRAAAEPLREALHVFEELGAAQWAERARDELRRAGPSAGGFGELTAVEERIARAVADGMTNREAAAALFISPKTVEAHLSRVYRKLGIRSRVQLSRYLESDGTYRESPDSS